MNYIEYKLVEYNLTKIKWLWEADMLDTSEEKIFNVSKYFDTYFECIVESNLTKEKAKSIADELNKKSFGPYVTYEVRK